MKYRATWIDAAGDVVKTDEFEYGIDDVPEEEREMFPHLCGICATLDAQYFTLEAMQEHVGGYIECVHVSDKTTAILNEEGKLRGMIQNPHPLVVEACREWELDDVFVGPAIIVQRVDEAEVEGGDGETTQG